jgi:hypothetical protein
MGGRVWLGLIGAIVGIGIAAAIFFLVISAAFVAWGALGALVFFGVILVGIAWYFDHRKQAEYD